MMPNLTPYRYGLNNPLRFIDPDGRMETEPPSLTFRMSLIDEESGEESAFIEIVATFKDLGDGTFGLDQAKVKDAGNSDGSVEIDLSNIILDEGKEKSSEENDSFIEGFSIGMIASGKEREKDESTENSLDGGVNVNFSVKKFGVGIEGDIGGGGSHSWGEGSTTIIGTGQARITASFNISQSVYLAESPVVEFNESFSSSSSNYTLGGKNYNVEVKATNQNGNDAFNLNIKND